MKTLLRLSIVNQPWDGPGTPASQPQQALV